MLKVHHHRPLRVAPHLVLSPARPAVTALPLLPVLAGAAAQVRAPVSSTVVLAVVLAVMSLEG